MTGLTIGLPPTLNDKERLARAAAPPPPKTALQAATERLTARAAKDKAAALRAYRPLVAKLARDEYLTEKEEAQLLAAMDVLNVTVAGIGQDVHALRAHATQLQAVEDNTKLLAELKVGSEKWDNEEIAAKKRIAEIHGLRSRVQGAGQAIGAHQAEASKLVAANPRAFGTDAA